jgi:hypothetical protein
VFELAEVPELRELEAKHQKLDRERQRTEKRWRGLMERVQNAHNQDIESEAKAIYEGKESPEPKEPKLRAQLEEAEREKAVREGVTRLAHADVWKYVSEHHDEIADAIRTAFRHQVKEAAENAKELLVLISRMNALEGDMGKLRPYAPQPERDPDPVDIINVVRVNTQSVFASHLNGVPPDQLQKALEGIILMAEELEEAEAEAVSGDEVDSAHS